MTEQFRASMNWLHTWAGLIVGAVLFACFWMGTLTVFDREFDRWMMPATRLPAAAKVDLDAAVRTLEPMAATRDIRRWGIQPPNDRVPVLKAFFDDAHGREAVYLNPATGALVSEERSRGGTGFFFPFHFTFLMGSFGEWMAGLAAMGMMVMCVSGVVIHKRIFTDFFMLRIVRKPQRTTLDIHNVTGVLGLPFNFMLALSGLIIISSVYLPPVQNILFFNDPSGYSKEASGNYSRPKIGEPGTIGSFEAMAHKAEQRWGRRPADMRVYNPGDAAAYVIAYRPYDDRVTMANDPIVFDAASGKVLAASTFYDRPMITTQRVISGIHFIQFRHWTLRWLYFVFGMAGCALIATGFLFWSQSRAKRHSKDGVTGMAFVSGLLIGSTIGLVIATLAYLVSNRLLPDQTLIYGHLRSDIEIWLFFAVWLVAIGHGWVAPRGAWKQQTLAVAVLAVAAPALNWITTGDLPWISIAKGQWAIIGIDIGLLLISGVAALAARNISRGKAAFQQISSPQAVPAE